MKLLKTVLFLGYSALQCPCSSVCSDTACQCRTVPKDHNRAFVKDVKAGEEIKKECCRKSRWEVTTCPKMC